ncbi:hypothetical protein CKO42_08585 [Lamprobacter modestohalophilus]|uniref:Uncharacterized protein n=1 Tax=Lamprobacter modestohalophilus TaxID=1064514 RepID=A0A9X1B3I3_9GAMM|nr:hypothetical protein [Lamprobacter modestohalophilus]MBK1618493.1 hypothetical protein [Lamprobacter modestohalophilus]
MLVVLILALLAMILSMIATMGQEPRNERLREAAEQVCAGAFWPRFRQLVWADPQARLIFP